MRKSVMISIHPKWCELIAGGKKTIEVRKTMPKIETPFKCYIYCTLSGSKKFFQETLNGDVEKWNRESWGLRKGKVIGEFVCDRIRCEHEVSDGLVDVVLEFTSCMDCKEILEYANGMSIYAWHISDLVIYDKPKELVEFYKRDTTYNNAFAWAFEDRSKIYQIKRPPRSWCYVEEVEG